MDVSSVGKPENVQVMHGLGLGLDEKAVEAVELWRFRPGMKDGQPEWMAQSAEVRFQIGGGEGWSVRQAAFAATKRDDSIAFVKPVLTEYTSPDLAACPVGGGGAVIDTSIDGKGRPRAIKLQRSPDPVTAASARAVESWRLRPALAGGKPSTATVRIEFECGRPLSCCPRLPDPTGQGHSDRPDPHL
jgi:outer membrane biosynthesis protein TonB